nr:reverse transcriptase domain-containing protein [Tanacetum cinerariifolium]
MPKFASTFKSLLSNKEKLFELASTPLDENCLAVLLKKLPEKLIDPGKFLIPCDFPKLEECLALADLGASINLMPLSIWKKLSLPELTSTRMTLELANRSTVIPTEVAKDVFVSKGVSEGKEEAMIGSEGVGLPLLEECLALADLGASINLMPLSIWKKLSLPELTSTRMTLELANRSTVIPTEVAKDVFVKVRKFYFLADIVVVDYDVDPRIPLIFRRPFLRTARALIDVHSEETTLRVNDEAITFKVGHTSRYYRNYYDETVHQVNVIDVACEEYAQEVLGFLDSSTSGNPTPSDPIIASSFPSLTPFEGKGDILYLEKLLNEDPSPNLLPVKNDDLKQVDVTMTKPSIEEPSKLKLKD